MRLRLHLFLFRIRDGPSNLSTRRGSYTSSCHSLEVFYCVSGLDLHKLFLFPTENSIRGVLLISAIAHISYQDSFTSFNASQHIQDQMEGLPELDGETNRSHARSGQEGNVQTPKKTVITRTTSSEDAMATLKVALKRETSKQMMHYYTIRVQRGLFATHLIYDWYYTFSNERHAMQILTTPTSLKHRS